MWPRRAIWLIAAIACVLASLYIVTARVFDRDRAHELDRLLARQSFSTPHIVLLQPAEDYLALFPELELMRYGLLPISQSTRVLPLFSLRAAPQLFALTSRASPRTGHGVHRWPRQVIDESEHFQLARITIERRALMEDLDRLTVSRVSGETTSPAEWAAGDHLIGRLRKRSGGVLGTIDAVEHRCIAVRAHASDTLRIDWPLDQAWSRGQVHLARRQGGAGSNKTRYTVRLQLRDTAGRLLRDSRARYGRKQLQHWQTLEIDAAGGALLGVEVGVSQEGRHELCVMGDLWR